MKNHFQVDTRKFAIALGTSIVSLALTVIALSMRRWAAALPLLLIALVFLYVMVLYGARISVTEKGVSRSFLHISMGILSWTDIQEVGVLGVKVFNGKTGRTGRRYIYLSPERLDDKRRFSLALEWPPKDHRILFLQYTQERLDTIQTQWSKPVDAYNAGDIFL